ncbi:MAG: tetratricopeptide repeat protein, partial [Chitinophagaceae bacterium]
ALSLTTILKQQHTDSAIHFLQKATQTLPASIALQIGLARGYQQKNEFDKALEICNNIINQFPNQLDALVLKSEILQQQNKTGEALATLEQAYAYAPFDIDLAHDLAYAYAEAKNAKAVALTDWLIKSNQSEKVAVAWYIKGLYYYNTGAKQSAISFYDNAIRNNYTLLDPYLAKGQALYDLKKYDEAITTFQLGQKVSPTTADFFYWIGKTQEATGNKQDAKQNYERAYQLDKTMTEARQAADKL